MTPDVTLVVTVHDETAVCGPTMDAADLAVAAARARGRRVQTIIALAAATEAATRYVEQPFFDHWERRVLERGDVGAVRNALATQSEGRHLCFVAAGDLVSENWLAESLAVLDAAAGRGDRVVAHPELDVVFDGRTEVRVNIGQDSGLFTPHHLYVGEHHPSSSLAPREALLEIPHATAGLTGREPCGDLQWTIETMAAGWRHVVVPDTIHFRRERDLPATPTPPGHPCLTDALPAMAIDRVRRLGRANGETPPPGA